MRLRPIEIETILQVAREIYGEGVSVYLFGSRTDDTKRGGDIDLLVRTSYPEKKGVLARIWMGSRIKLRLGDQKIDIIGDDEESPVAHEALKTGILLQ
jgi:predicted nucleotidyltransferase